MKKLVSLPLALLAACASSGGDAADGGGGAGGDGPPPSPCTQIEETCARKQQGCVLDGETPRCVDCGVHETPDATGACAPIPGDRQETTFSTLQLAPGEEQNGVCQSWTLNNPTELWVNGVELVTGGGYHHSNWLFVPDDEYVVDDGAWRCRDLDYSEIDAATKGGVLFAQSTQSIREVQKFPEGVAVRLPPYTRILAGTHLLNASAEPLETTISMAIYTIPADQVRVKLTPFRLSYLDLEIPPHASSDFTGACDFAETHEQLLEAPLDMKLYWVLPHAHMLASGFTLDLLGGRRDGERIFESASAAGETNGRVFDPPLDLRAIGARGVTFTCSYENPRDEVVGWGVGDQEMCVMLGFAESRMMADATVIFGESHEVVEGRERFEGHCNVIGFEENHDSPGGPPR